ncbi:thioesterase II family protein [Streptomyces sp. NPDC056796]|uniref:thioesterase II family protein n=1 Tax=Streptomyces sp. NPDC056796 TaxID=3345947 RepID=UPI0036A41C78
MTVLSRGRARTWFRRYPARSGAPRLRLVRLPHAGGTATLFDRWAGLLPDGLEVPATRYPGRQERFGGPCASSMTELADAITDALETGLRREQHPHHRYRGLHRGPQEHDHQRQSDGHDREHGLLREQPVPLPLVQERAAAHCPHPAPRHPPRTSHLVAVLTGSPLPVRWWSWLGGPRDTGLISCPPCTHPASGRPCTSAGTSGAAGRGAAPCTS